MATNAFNFGIRVDSRRFKNKQMTQEEHWKKAYRDLQKEFGRWQNERFCKLKKYFEDKRGKEELIVAQMNSKLEWAEKLINELESALYFTHDDIRSSLDQDTVSRIEHGLDSIKITGEIFVGLNDEAKRGLHASADVLCWVLRHDHNTAFEKNFSNLQAEIKAAGYNVTNVKP